MIQHLRMITTEEFVEGRGMVTTLTPADPSDPDNWIDDPCSFCGGESFPAQCPGDGRRHHHGAIHPPGDSGVAGYWYLCRSPDCRALADAAWSAFRERVRVGRRGAR